MAKQVRVVQAAYNWDHKHTEAGVHVRAYLTQVAGLAVCHTHRIRVNNKLKTKELVTLKSWDIITYPSGHAILQGFRTKKKALAAVEHDLAAFSWVCMFFEDFQRNNDMNAVRKKLIEIKKRGDLYAKG